MATTANHRNSQGVEINYIDYGQGRPVVLIHGWPLSHKSWEKQIPALVDGGYRVIAYDRRGFGDSGAPWEGYDYDSLALDLHELMNELDLKDTILVGFSMGGGEVVRYLSTYGADRVSRIALVASIIPLVKQLEDNPEGVPEKDLKDIMVALKNDRVGFLKGFHEGFYNVNIKKDAVSQQQLDYDFSIASHAAPHATIGAAQAWMDTDFRDECAKVTVPTLIIHGKADNTVPFATSARQAKELIKGSKLVVYDDGPHGLNVTHAEKLNKDLLDFFSE